MSRHDRVVLRFIASKEAGESAVLFDRMKLVAASGQDLVCVGLVSDVPDKTIVRRIENVMHRDRKLDGPERRSSMTADAGAGVDNELPNLVGDFLQVFDFQLSEVGRRVDLG